ncbi:hypothetical protein CLOM_g10307 [Closterium sp. NIES-68]|nr:hypothetical protein CLOM_g10307 [Closterium sp. NIES-68]
MPCKGHGGIEGVAIAVAPTTTKVVAGLGTSGGVVALVQEEEGNGGKQPHGGANMVADPAEETSKDERGMGNEERNVGQFYHVCDKDDSGTAVARAGEELHPLDMWVMDSGAAWTMTPRKDFLDAVRAPPISEELGAVKAGSGVKGECNAVSAAGVTVSARFGETDWETAHRRLGHVAMPLLQQLHKEEAVKGLKLSGQPNDTKCETCLLSKFTRFPFHGVAGKSKAALELVHMDLVGPFPVRGSKGERYFLAIVDDWSRLMWAYPLKQKDHAASTIRDDWLPFVEQQSGHPCKSIRTDRGQRSHCANGKRY